MVQWELIMETDQQMTVKLFHQDIGKHIMMTFVYAKCSSLERLELWDNMYYMAAVMELPWLVGGDFNVVLHEDKKIGGLPVYPLEYEDFAFYVNSCGLFDQVYKGSPFTWWNGRTNDACIFKRLDGILTSNFVKPFKFLNFWTKNATFKEVVIQNWDADFIEDPFVLFNHKLKKVKVALSKWSKDTFGDIFKQIAILEDIVKVKEMLFEGDRTTESRIVLQKAQAELKNFLRVEEQYWNKKSAMTWFAEGDRNTTFFHNLVNGKRKKLQLQKFRMKMATGRIIFENILLTQEIVTYIRLRGKPANVVIQLDMAKAYDRVSWKYLLHVLRRMGFAEHFINMVWNLVSNNRYSILVNGQSSAEVLSRTLNKLFEDKSFVGFGMPKWSEPLNYLAYADDTIIFASAHPSSLSKMMAVLGSYKEVSGQMINKYKSSYYMHANVAHYLFRVVGQITGFTRGKFPFTYLGCPIFYTRRRKAYYEELVKKVKAKMHSWKEKLLSFGGRATLITSVLQSMPVHLLSMLAPPANILEHLLKIFAWFFWSTKEEGRSRHWASWQNLCLPKQEGGLRFRSLHDVSRTLLLNFGGGSELLNLYALTTCGTSWFKGNTDEASKGNPGPSLLGFCVRNDVGDLVYARAVDLGITTNVIGEAKAIMQGLTYCIDQDLHPLILETDSLVLKKVIKGEWEPHWSIVAEVRKLKEMRDHFNVIFQHVFSEGNTVADFIANIVFSFACTSEFKILFQNFLV
nr:uncharacterized protein LOC104119987 [Nicotiana tomentosiformis]